MKVCENMDWRVRRRIPLSRVLLRGFILIDTVFLLLALLGGCGQAGGDYEETRSLMATYVTVRVVSEDEDRAQRAVDKAFAEMARLERILSIWQEDTEISRINRTAQTHPVPVSEEIVGLTRTALEVSEKTLGAFDPTIGPLVSLWRVTRRTVPPTEEEIAEALAKVDYRKVVLEGHTVRILGEGTTLDFGGIAKGYAADRAVTILKKEGIQAGIVSVAGDIRVFGGKSRGRSWKVGIQNPRGSGLIARFLMDDGCISTSGDYERYFEYKGRRYHHILNPKTGHPAKGVRSVSVVDQDSVLCDGLATGFFALGPSEGLKVMEDQGIAGLMVDDQGEIHMTSALRENYRIELTEEERSR